MADPKYPELSKLGENHEKVLVIYEFLSWLEGNGMVICETDHSRDYNPYTRVYVSETNLAYDFLKIDSKKIEEERTQLLEHQRELNKKK